MNKDLNTAINAAVAGGAILKRYFETALSQDDKDDASIVTQADRESEASIRGILSHASPADRILGEEEGESGAEGPRRWVIDPLDGTKNFTNGLPIFAVSIALMDGPKVIVAAVHNPITDSLYYASLGEGAFWNYQRTQVSDEAESRAMVTIGRSRQEADRSMSYQLYNELPSKIAYVRNLGSTALELAYVARGGTEGFYNLGTQLWDYAAGTLLVTEAGGMITTLSGSPWASNEAHFIASNGVIHDTLLSKVPNKR
jgi:myo-inositol-1(or 4)-monophosphatase